MLLFFEFILNFIVEKKVLRSNLWISYLYCSLLFITNIFKM